MMMGNISWLAAGMTICLAMTGFAFSADAKAPTVPDLPESASSLGAIACDGWLYVYGGHTGKTHQYSTETASGRFHRLKLDGGQSWEELPSGPGLQGMNLAASGGKIYRVGGMQPRNKPSEPADSHSVADVACYDPASRRWEPMPSLPEPRSSHDVVALNNKLYVVGGWIMHGAQPSVWTQKAFVLDLVQPGAKWQTIEQPFQRRALTAAAVNGKVYVLGGLTDHGDAVQRVDVLDTQSGKWSEGPAFPGQSVGFSPAACELGGRFYLSVSDGNVHRLKSAGDGWESVGEFKIKRMVHRLVPRGSDSIVALGGVSRDGDPRKLESITIASSR
jgi:N-acetylneuraminic acid mutarotase